MGVGNFLQYTHCRADIPEQYQHQGMVTFGRSAIDGHVNLYQAFCKGELQPMERGWSGNQTIVNSAHYLHGTLFACGANMLFQFTIASKLSALVTDVFTCNGSVHPVAFLMRAQEYILQHQDQQELVLAWHHVDPDIRAVMLERQVAYKVCMERVLEDIQINKAVLCFSRGGYLPLDHLTAPEETCFTAETAPVLE